MFLPVLLMGNVPGTEILRPMAIAALGGLATSTLFMLFGVPALFLLVGAGHRPDLDDLTLTMSDEELREAMAHAGLNEQPLRAPIRNP
jgi:hypothetical protein